MKNSKHQKPFLLYTIIIILALVILALGGLTLYSFQDLASLRSKVTDLQNTVQEISDTSAEQKNEAVEPTTVTAASATAQPQNVKPHWGSPDWRAMVAGIMMARPMPHITPERA